MTRRFWQRIGWDLVVYAIVLIICIRVGEIIRAVHPALAWISGVVLFPLLYRMANERWKEAENG